MQDRAFRVEKREVTQLQTYRRTNVLQNVEWPFQVCSTTMAFLNTKVRWQRTT